MSKITTVYDFLTSELATLFPSKTIIPKPITLDNNQIAFLRDSYGLYFKGKTFVDGELCKLNLAYDFGVVVCREVYRTDSNVEAHFVAEKALLEDTFTLEKHFYDVDTISIPDELDKLDVTPTSGTAEFIPGRNDFYYMELNLTARIREDY